MAILANKPGDDQGKQEDPPKDNWDRTEEWLDMTPEEKEEQNPQK